MIAALRPLILLLGWWTFAAVCFGIGWCCVAVAWRQVDRVRAYRRRRRAVRQAIEDVLLDAEILEMRRSLGWER